jgi:hypothetical protein
MPVQQPVSHERSVHPASERGGPYQSPTISDGLICDCRRLRSANDIKVRSDGAISFLLRDGVQRLTSSDGRIDLFLPFAVRLDPSCPSQPLLDKGDEIIFLHVLT